jgi:uncharacterized OB-fold protein
LTPRRPLPVPDALSTPYWEATAAHVLTVARCSQCGRAAMPPDATCPHCRSSDPAFRFEAVRGSGVVRSWTVVRQSFLPGFQVPFVLVDVELDDAPEVRLIGQLTDGVDGSLHVGAAVQVTFDDLTPEIAVPAFSLA